MPNGQLELAEGVGPDLVMGLSELLEEGPGRRGGPGRLSRRRRGGGGGIPPIPPVTPPPAPLPPPGRGTLGRGRPASPPPRGPAPKTHPFNNLLSTRRDRDLPNREPNSTLSSRLPTRLPQFTINKLLPLFPNTSPRVIMMSVQTCSTNQKRPYL